VGVYVCVFGCAGLDVHVFSCVSLLLCVCVCVAGLVYVPLDDRNAMNNRPTRPTT
jgi:hypothetical protein